MKKYRAYSLLELSIVLFIMSILLTSGGLLFSNISRNQNIKEAQIITLERTDKIYKAISNYLAENHRLPCPAKLNINSNDSNYGAESRNGEDCDMTGLTGLSGSANPENNTNNLGLNINMNLIYGMVPTDILNLNKQDVEDGYGRKFGYAIIKEFGTKTGTNLGFESYSGTKRLGEIGDFEYIKIMDNSTGTEVTVTNKAIMLLISHGENGAGAYNPDTGFPISTNNFTSDENDNFFTRIADTESSATIYDRRFFIDSNETNSSTSQIGVFDDLVIFKTKDQLIRDAGLEFIECSADEGFIDQSYDSLCFQSNGEISPKSYGEIANISATISALNCGCETNEAVLQRTCGKYGKWSDIFCNENYKLYNLDEIRADGADGLKLYDDDQNGIFIEDGGNVGINQTNPYGDLFIGDSSTIDSYTNNVNGLNISRENNFFTIAEKNSTTSIKDIGLSLTNVSATNNSYTPLLAFSAYSSHNSESDYNHIAGIAAQQRQIDGSTHLEGDLIFHTKDGTGNLTEKIRIKDDGNVGIGTSDPNYKLQVNGSAAGTGDWVNISDKRYKDNIKSLKNILPKIMKLNAVYYDWKRGEFPDKNFSKKRQIGFIAQEVEKLFPELVHNDNSNYKSIAYSKITAILVRAIQELQEEQNIEIQKIKKSYDQKIEKLIKRIEKLEDDK